VIDLATNAVTTVATRSALGGGATSVAISPDGGTAYFAAATGSVAVVDTASNAVTRQVPAPGSVGPFPNVAVTPSGSTVYLAAGFVGPANVYPFDTAAGTFGATIPASTGTSDIMMSPDQAPVAALSVTPEAAGSASSFDASGSTVKYGTIASYHWDFGDGESATTATPTTTHVYASGGDYTVTLTETSSNGTSTTKVFTGQAMLRNGGPSAQVTASLTVPAAGLPAVSIAKSASVPSFAAAGTAITYTYTVTNEGSVPLDGVTVTDSRLGSVCGAPFALAAGESRPCTVDYITTAADVAAGQIANTVTVTGEAPDPQSVHDTASLSIPLAERPAVSIAKTDSVPSFAVAGTAITYTYTVTDNGNVPLQDIAVTDTRLGAVDCPATTLAVGQAVTCTAAYHTTAADVTGGRAANSATVTAATADGLAVAGHASLAIPRQDRPAVSLEKNASAASFTAAGQAVTYTFLVTDNGNVPLRGVNVTDTQAGPVSCPAAVLAVGAAMTCTAVYHTTAADVSGRAAADTATVTAADPAGLRLTGQDSLVIPLVAVRLPQVPVTG
jgi:PKD repeat protein